MYEGEGVGGGVGEHPQHVLLRQLGQRELQEDADQEYAVKDGQALEEVGKAWLQLNILLVQRPHTNQVSCSEVLESIKVSKMNSR